MILGITSAPEATNQVTSGYSIVNHPNDYVEWHNIENWGTMRTHLALHT